MFVEVIQGQVTDPAALRAAFEEWQRDLAPGATGWLGATSGVTDDGRFIGIVRFASTADARRNADRPEQTAWWNRHKHLLGDNPTMVDSEDVDLDLIGDPDRAGFVQFMVGRMTDLARARELMKSDPEEFAALRPDVLGTVTVNHGDGAFTTVIYFTSEAEAREGERKEPPPEVQAQMAEMGALMVGEPEWFDLRDPWLETPA
ncbi:hypothetical protein GCM10009682_30230 [Luedemannella flava]|uniref:Uncharacterized protein n=1 Tax=Luedemannella flava TaxID=349316 RepID=A0ABN2M1H9_9ACTN